MGERVTAAAKRPALPPGPSAAATVGSPTSDYLELAPSPRLASQFLCLWVQSIGDGGTDYPQRVLPDGCADIVWIGQAGPMLVGPATRSVIAPLPPRSIVIGARCRPGFPACSAWRRARCRTGSSRCAMSEAEGSTISSRLWRSRRRSRESSPSSRRLSPESCPSPDRPTISPSQRLPSWPAIPPAACVSSAARSASAIASCSAASWPRSAYGPKTFQRVLRFQRAPALARNGLRSPPSLACIALGAGYADQAHMTREIRTLAGRRPTDLLSKASTTLAMSHFFNTGDRAVD